MVVRCRKHASERRSTRNVSACERWGERHRFAWVRMPKMNPVRDWHPVQLLDRSAIMRQGHSGASGQGDVIWSAASTPPKQMRRQKMQRDLFFCGNQILSKSWGKEQRSVWVYG